jgi:hypothetical protein
MAVGKSELDKAPLVSAAIELLISDVGVAIVLVSTLAVEGDWASTEGCCWVAWDALACAVVVCVLACCVFACAVFFGDAAAVVGSAATPTVVYPPTGPLKVGVAVT